MSKIFLDTNVLVSLIDTTRINHKKALRLIGKIKRKELQGFISTQIVGEFYVSLTRIFVRYRSTIKSRRGKGRN